ncbi:MAG: Zn-dependent exopeptidase M28 [Flavobacteriales bacterium]|nr:Zn-dependent exopeptidase M28 [Flavobacteriales bacterium]
MRTSFAALLLLVGAPLLAQTDAPEVAQARQYIQALCAPEMHGRGYVNGGDSIAADYIAAQFKRLGLEQVKESYFEPFSFRVNTFPEKVSLAIDGKPLIAGTDFLVDPASGSASGRMDLVHISKAQLAFPELRAMAMSVIPGKAVALDLPPTKNADSIALYNTYIEDMLHYGPVLRKETGKLTWGVAQEAHPFPLIQVAADAWPDSAEYVDIVVKNRLVKHHARNVLAKVKGRSGKRTLVLTAHYDHLGRMGEVLFPGANDNASGVSMLLNLAAHFAQNKPKYDILFIAFAGEEAGLLGSEWCAVDRAFDLSSVRMLINMDLMGTGDDGIMVVNATDQKEVYDQLLAINERSRRLAAVKSRGPACNSDHCPFVKRGVPGIFIYTLGGITAYHDVLDVPETLPLTDYHDLYLTLIDLIDGL